MCLWVILKLWDLLLEDKAWSWQVGTILNQTGPILFEIG